MKLLMSLMVPFLFCGSILSADEAVTHNIENAIPNKDLLKFQAQERRRFYDDMLADRHALQQETTLQQRELLERQRKDRRDFHPERHTIDERREFFTKQREEMLVFKAQQNEKLQKLKADQKKRREDFHALQKTERQEAFNRLKGKLLPGRVNEEKK